MRDDAWRRHLLHGHPEPVLASWLNEPDSLTARCQRHCNRFRVRLLLAGLVRPNGDEAPRRPRLPGREVLLECDGVPVIFAHSVLLTACRGRLSRWLAGLGSRSLGSLLFAIPGFRREPLEFRRLDARHPMFRRAAVWSGGARQLWARRSVHHLDGQALVVTEVFLPAVVRLEAGPATN